MRRGFEEGEICGVNCCKGTLKYLVHNCTRFLGYPPCNACISAKLECSRCGRKVEPKDLLENMV